MKVERGVSITAGKAQKRADYAFYISPEFRSPKFFVEAKKPSRNLKNPDDYFQTIRYGWNANTPVAVLTDFQEFHILDCRFKPDVEYVLLNQNHKSYGYSQYSDLEKFKEIYYLFSRSEVENGSLEKYSESLPKPKGKSAQKGIFPATAKPIDEDFLEYIDDVRETLAKAFKRNDASLTSEQLTEVTQKTVDRLVFIRFLEDKLIEPEYYISELGRKSNPWKEFVSLCRKLDAKYNGIVFKETVIDKQTFKGPDETEFLSICDGISRINSPYDFHYIPIHILGSIYERFLGKIVTLKGRGIKIEEKPEVRKAGGVYYTPKYIVDYIVKNTVGKLIENKTPEEISKLRFADIACGSGSFLIGVYEHLLEYHKAYYQSRRKQAEKDGCIDVNGIMTLSLRQKQEILLNNIYGVDIDHQAVEVTQLSLALKMLEDETTYTTRQMQMDFQKKIIPGQLSKNIVCGNSLIGTDILSRNMFAGDEERKLNPLDFETAFPHVFCHSHESELFPSRLVGTGNPNNCGFDAIVGNPPYVRVDILSDSTKDYILSKFCSAKGKYDLYYLFLERAFGLINKTGKLSYIIPNRFSTSDSGYELRKLLIQNSNEIFINSVSKIKVFKNAATYPCILIISKSNKNQRNLVIKESNKIEDLYDLNKLIKFNDDNIYKLPNLIVPLNSDEDIINLYFNLTKNSDYSENILLIQEGFRIPKEIEKESGDFHLVKQYQFKRYSQISAGSFVTEKSLYKTINPKSNRFVNCLKPKLIFAEDALVIEAIIDLSYSICQGGVYFATIIDKGRIDLKYLLGLFNSKLLSILYKNLFSGMHMGGGYLRFRTSFLNKLPIKKINSQNPSEKQSHDLIVTLVDQMLDAKKKLHEFKTEKDKTYYERKCESLDRQIDSEVYKLYGLTDEEIKIVEGKN